MEHPAGAVTAPCFAGGHPSRSFSVSIAGIANRVPATGAFATHPR
jgi:hypothetical protein